MNTKCGLNARREGEDTHIQTDVLTNLFFNGENFFNVYRTHNTVLLLCSILPASVLHSLNLLVPSTLSGAQISELQTRGNYSTVSVQIRRLNIILSSVLFCSQATHVCVISSSLSPKHRALCFLDYIIFFLTIYQSTLAKSEYSGGQSQSPRKLP